jgi:hypothetical protein
MRPPAPQRALTPTLDSDTTPLPSSGGSRMSAAAAHSYTAPQLTLYRHGTSTCDRRPSAAREQYGRARVRSLWPRLEALVHDGGGVVAEGRGELAQLAHKVVGSPLLRMRYESTLLGVELIRARTSCPLTSSRVTSSQVECTSPT